MTNDSLPALREQQRLTAPGNTPQALAWHQNALWIGSRDLGSLYEFDVRTNCVVREIEPPGVPWAAVSTGPSLTFTLGIGEQSDRYLQRYFPEKQRWEEPRVPCPEFTGSYLSWDGAHIYLSQWYNHRILQLDATGKITQVIDVGEEISGHTFANGELYVLRGTEEDEQGKETWRIARLNSSGRHGFEDLARVPFACRSLTFDGQRFWSNHRAAGETVSFRLP
jgi:hypothetical protein